MTIEQSGAKKSLYVFLSSMLGSMLFLILHRLVVMSYAILVEQDYNTYGLGLSLVEWLAIDYITLVLSILLGAWYGVWLGLHWYKSVYEEGMHHGFVDHLICRFWPPKSPTAKLRSQIVNVAERLGNDADQLEHLAVQATMAEPVNKPAVKRRITRKKTVK